MRVFLLILQAKCSMYGKPPKVFGFQTFTYILLNAIIFIWILSIDSSHEEYIIPHIMFLLVKRELGGYDFKKLIKGIPLYDC